MFRIELQVRQYWVRDVTLGEDASRVRKGAVPQVMAPVVEYHAESAAAR